MAEALAREIISHPYECMLADRASVYTQHNLSLHDALEQEFTRAKPIAQHQIHSGATQFVTHKQHHQH